MTPEEKQKMIDLENKVQQLESILTNLGGSLEFKTLVQTYATDDSATQTISNLTVTDSFGAFGATPVGQQSDIAAPSGGATQDAEARTAINSIRSVLDTFGFTA